MKEAWKLALEALEYWDVHGKLHQPTEEAITAIKAALAQQDHSEQHLDMVKAQQEPWCMKMNGCETKCEDCPVEVAEPQPEERNFCPRCGKRTADLTVIHTCTPPQRKPLTDDEIWKFWCSRPEVLEGEDDSMEAEFVTAVRAVLAAHNIKENT